MSQLPKPCVETCDAAYLVAQSIGKAPSLCDPDTGFLDAYYSCRDCVLQLTAGDSTGSARDDVDSRFQQFLGFCDSQNPDPSGLPTGSPEPSTNTEGVAPTTDIGSEPTTDAGEVMVTIIYSNPNGAGTMLVPESDLSNQGWVKNSNATKTPAPERSDPSTDSPGDSPNQAWIAGPVVGALAGLGLLLGLGLWLLRRRRKPQEAATAEDEDVPELDPKPVPHQLHSTETPKPKHELTGSEGRHIAEMPANEPAGHEMEGERLFEKGPSDAPRIKRKPLNSVDSGDGDA